jgi:hypothetical protein
MISRCARYPVLFAACLIAAPAFADVVGVSRCDQQQDGVFRPGLLTVSSDGTRVFHPVGENGLTETTVFNRSEAFAWVANQGLFPAGTTFENYDDFICGLPCEECEAEETEEEPDHTNGDETNGQTGQPAD